MNRERRTQVIAVLLGGTTIGGALLLRARASDAIEPLQATAPTRPLAHVRVRSPERKTIWRTIKVPADVLAWSDATMFARASGYVREIAVDLGSRVAPGDVLAILDAPELESAVAVAAAGLSQASASVREARSALMAAGSDAAVAETRLEEARAEIAQSEAELALRTVVRERLEKARATSPNLVAQDVLDDALGQWEIASADLVKARAALGVEQARLVSARARVSTSEAGISSAEAGEEAARAELEAARTIAGFTRITAPFPGIVAERWVDRGDLVRNASGSGATSAVVRVLETSRMRIRFRVAEPDAPAAAPGRKFRLTVDELPGRELEGVVARIADSLDLETRTMVVEGELDNSDGSLRHGTFGRVALDLEEHQGALVIPAEAVTTVKRRSSVLIAENGVVVRRAIRTGYDDGLLVEVLEGLSEKDAVITAGMNLVAEGDPVEAVREAGQ